MAAIGVRRQCFRGLHLEPLEVRWMLAFSVGTEFTASSNTGFTPPDTMGAVGPNQIVELINGRYAVYNKAGLQQTATSLDQFWINAGVNPAGAFAFDPRVLYDAAGGRFFAAAVDNSNGPNNFLVAVSNTSDPMAGWTGFQIDSDSNNSHWADFPTLGVNADVVTISANMFPLAGQPATTSFLVIPKSDLLAGVPTVANATLFENINANNTGFGAEPIVDLDNGSLPLPLLSSFNKPAGSLKTSSIGGTALAPTLNTSGGFISVVARSAPPDIDQPGPKANIDAGDSRFSGSVIKQQISGRANSSLWGVHSVNISGRAAIEWYEINAATDAVLQSGTIADPSLAFNFPSIAVNDFGDVVIGFSGGDPATFMSTYVAVGSTTAGVTTFSPPTQTHAGVADYQILDSNGTNRWGDYSATVIDPTDQKRFWTFQEFASATDQWSVRVTEILLASFVTAHAIFYNNSGFDGNTPGASASDASAIDTSKSPYFPGGGAITPSSMTNYTKGINGVMVEMTGPHGTLTANDFTVRMSEQLLAANDTPSTWTAAPTPSVTVFSDTPVAGTDRIALIWPDGSIVDRYLEVIVEGDDAAGGNNTNTGLAESEIFFYGNKIGDDFTSYPGFYNTDATDEIDARGHQGLALSPANAYDFNKDFSVDATDQIVARTNGGFMPAISISNPPAAPAPPSVEGADGEIAVALNVPAAAAKRDSSPSALVSGRVEESAPAAAAESSGGASGAAASPAGVDDAEATATELALDDDLLDELLDEILA